MLYTAIVKLILAIGLWRFANLVNIMGVGEDKDILTKQELSRPGPPSKIGLRCIIYVVRFFAVLVFLYACFCFCIGFLAGQLFNADFFPLNPSIGISTLSMASIIGEYVYIKNRLYQTSDGVFFKYSMPLPIQKWKFQYRAIAIIVFIILYFF